MAFSESEPRNSRLAVAHALSRWGRWGLWTQGVLGLIALITLLVAGLGGISTAQGGAGLFLGVCSLVLLAISGVRFGQCWRQGNALSTSERDTWPRREELLRGQILNLWLSLAGLLLIFFGAFAVVGTLVFTLQFAPQDALLIRGFVTSLKLDVLVLQALMNGMLAHFAGLGITLWLLRSLTAGRPNGSP